MALTLAAKLWIRAPQIMGDQAVDLQQFPKALADWVAQEHNVDEKITHVLRTDQILLRNYVSKNGKRLELFVGYYRDQKFGAQVHSPQHCLPGSGWTIVRYSKFPLPFTMESFANQLHITKNNENQFVVYWFTSDGKLVQNEWVLKVRLMLNAFMHRPTAVYFYRLSVPVIEGEEDMILRSLTEFMLAAAPYLHHPAKV
jgi:EpsI family protein